MKTFKTTMAMAVALAALSVPAGAVNILPGFSGGGSLPANDDGSTGLLPIGFSVKLDGMTYGSLYANNNGNVTFDGPLASFTPGPIASGGAGRIIAPFWGDVDTRGMGSDLLTYGAGMAYGRAAFGVTWDSGAGVGYFVGHTDKLNKFQLILVERGDTGVGNFDIYFNYDQIQWETGDASGGSGGSGGSSARAGYFAGAMSSFELAGSGVNGALLDGGSDELIGNSNIGDDGVFCFSVRDGVIIRPVPDAGSTLMLLGLGVTGLAMFRRRK